MDPGGADPDRDPTHEENKPVSGSDPWEKEKHLPQEHLKYRGEDLVGVEGNQDPTLQKIKLDPDPPKPPGSAPATPGLKYILSVPLTDQR